MRNLFKVLMFLSILLLLSFLLPNISGQVNLLWGIFIDIFVAAGLTYVSYPLVRFLKEKGIPRAWATIITVLVFFSMIGVAIFLIVRLIYPQILNVVDLFSNSESTIELFTKNEVFMQFYNYIEPYLSNISSNILQYTAGFTQAIINQSTSFIGAAVLIVCLYIYMLADYDRLLTQIKSKLKFGSRRYEFFKELDVQYMHYLRGLIIIIVITIFEYAIVYYFIGHPDWMALAALCAFSNLIPYFGGIIVNIIALITAVFVSPTLFYMVLVCVIVLPIIEGNVINPMVHKKTIKISPIVLLPSIFVAGGLFGMLGIILSIPAIIFYKIFKKYYGEDVKAYFVRVWNA